MTRSYPSTSFGRAYELLCREKGLRPVSAIKWYPQDKRLRFCADRIIFEDWLPILQTIAEDRSIAQIVMYSRSRCKKIRERLNTSQKIEEFRLQRHSRRTDQPFLYTNFVLHGLLDALSSSARKSLALTSLTLDGIPLTLKYLRTLCEGLKLAKNLTALSLARCRIGDAGCDVVLNSLANNSKLSTLNLSYCRLTSRSSMSLTVFLKKRKADLLQNEWTENVFGQSARDESETQGFSTLVLNHNRKLSDHGVRLLVNVLKEDFWVKTLNIRHCGVTKSGGEALIELLKTNSVVTAMDMKENDIPQTILQNVSKILHMRYEKGERVPMSKRLLNSRYNCQETKTRQTKKAHFTESLKCNPIVTSNHRSQRSRITNKKRVNATKQSRSRPKLRYQKLTRRRTKDADDGEKLNTVKLSTRMNRVIDDDAIPHPELISDRELLTEIKKRRIEVEKEISELEPWAEILRNGIRDQDRLHRRILEEGRVFGSLQKVFTRLQEGLGGFTAVQKSEHPVMQVGKHSKEVLVTESEAWKIVSETDLGSPQVKMLNLQRGRPHCPRKLRG